MFCFDVEKGLRLFFRDHLFIYPFEKIDGKNGKPQTYHGGPARCSSDTCVHACCANGLEGSGRGLCPCEERQRSEDSTGGGCGCACILVVVVFGGAQTAGWRTAHRPGGDKLFLEFVLLILLLFLFLLILLFLILCCRCCC